MYFVWRADPWLKSHPRVRLGLLISGDASVTRHVENVGKSAVRDVRRGHMMRPAWEMCLRWCTAEVNESARPGGGSKGCWPLPWSIDIYSLIYLTIYPFKVCCISNAFRFLALLLWEIPLRRETVCVDTPRSSGKKACVNCQHQIDTGAANLLPGQHSRACATRTLTDSLLRAHRSWKVFGFSRRWKSWVETHVIVLKYQINLLLPIYGKWVTYSEHISATCPTMACRHILRGGGGVDVTLYFNYVCLFPDGGK